MAPPTASASATAKDWGRWLHYGRLLADAVDSRWQKWVLGFSADHQARMMQSIGLGFLNQYGLIIALLIGSALVMRFGVWILRQEPGRRDPIAICYQRFCRHFGKAGIIRRESEGPRDYGLRIIAEMPQSRKQADGFLSLYIEIRYGRSGSVANRQRLQQLLAEVKKTKSTKQSKATQKPQPSPDE